MMKVWMHRILGVTLSMVIAAEPLGAAYTPTPAAGLDTNAAAMAGEEMSSPLTAGLTDWSECPELGAIGDLLASSDFAATVSVLVVQQYVGPWAQDDDMDLPDSPVHSHDQPNAIYGLEDPS